ncbi:type II toxin-antitoxin system VapC family toxin [Chitinophaga japonensis]|uniref:PIN domain-containing protein n=1 Tax=Chitinophaga japonensis TaxID=104662 RepID=A0A562TCE0_CHIJA|nr:type II toxin-antitoxin system VapC family toxin [Chitinophaga japonensis]TWI90948.1 hypothetical protein LX66_0309 [Chitinophaga japonensis]
MEQGYLIDTNTVIDFLDNKLPEKAAVLVENLVPQISVITRMELLAWPQANEQQLQVLQAFITVCNVLTLDEAVIVKAIELRKTYRIKLPDAIIAATAVVWNLTLISRNIADFKNIQGLQIVNPHELA